MTGKGKRSVKRIRGQGSRSRIREVVPHKDRWAIVFRTRREAEERAKEMLRELGGGTLRIQGRTGAFRSSDVVVRRQEDSPVMGSLRVSLKDSSVRGSVDVVRPPAEEGESATQISEVIEALMPDRVPTPATILQAWRNSAARTSLMEEFGLLTSAEIAELNESEAENRAALASRWKREGRIFSVKHRGRDYFPGFQFDREGQPREVMVEILELFDGGYGWETALWFTAPNGYLDGQRPVDLLESDPQAVVDAAEHEAAEVYF